MSLEKKTMNFEYFVVLDFEATCDVNQNKSLSVQEIIEWPAMIIDIKRKKILKKSFHYYIKPKIHARLTPFCTKLTGINQKMVNNGETIVNVVNKWNTFCKNNKLILKNENKIIPNACVITCGDWDLAKMWPMQKNIDKKISNALLFDKWINIETIYKRYCMKNGEKCKGMMNLLKCLNIKHVGKHHSGIDDVRNICNIVIHLLNNYKYIKWNHTTHKNDKFFDSWKSKNKKVGDWKCSKCEYLNFASRDVCKSCSVGKKPKNNLEKVNKKPWKCSNCNYFNFGSRDLCKRCSIGVKPKQKNNKQKNSPITRKEGDWDCIKCNEMNFKFRRFCLKCKTPKPKNINDDNNKKDALIVRKPGDWDCVYCNTLNFKFRKECFGCGKQKNAKKIDKNNNHEMKNDDKKENNNNNNNNEIDRKPGDWDCVYCNTLNFKFRKECFGCNKMKIIKKENETDEGKTTTPKF